MLALNLEVHLQGARAQGWSLKSKNVEDDHSRAQGNAEEEGEATSPEKLIPDSPDNSGTAPTAKLAQEKVPSLIVATNVQHGLVPEAQLF